MLAPRLVDHVFDSTIVFDWNVFPDSTSYLYSCAYSFTDIHTHSVVDRDCEEYTLYDFDVWPGGGSQPCGSWPGWLAVRQQHSQYFYLFLGRYHVGVW